MLLLYVRLLTLVQILHGITAVHKTDDEVTFDSLLSKKRANCALSTTAGNLNCVCGIRRLIYGNCLLTGNQTSIYHCLKFLLLAVGCDDRTLTAIAPRCFAFTSK